MRLAPISGKIVSELRKVEHARKVDNSPKAKVLQKTDTTNFSENAQRLSKTKASVEIVASQIQNTPEVRQEKVEEVREKIQQGFYNSSDFAGRLAEKLIADFGPGGGV